MLDSTKKVFFFNLFVINMYLQSKNCKQGDQTREKGCKSVFD